MLFIPNNFRIGSKDSASRQMHRPSCGAKLLAWKQRFQTFRRICRNRGDTGVWGMKTPQYPPENTRVFLRISSDNNMLEVLAGMVGFEPTIYCTKNRCPTARPHPNTRALFTLEHNADQDRKRKKIPVTLWALLV